MGGINNLMARLVFIGGASGSGKSSSLMDFEPESTFIINADAHELPFRYVEKYSEKLGNYTEDSSIASIKNSFKIVNEEKRFERLVIDTWSRVMTDYIMARPFRAAIDGRKAWGKFAQDMYDLLDAINNVLRKDLVVYLLCHTEKYINDTGVLVERISTHGQQLNRFVPESFSTVVLYTQVEALPGQKPKYYFRTETSGFDTCKTPMGMFEEALIPNNLPLAEKIIKEYYT